MMKKLRTDGAPKFRRSTVKGTLRGGRLGVGGSESAYLSSSSLVYLKFLAIWLTCIALDILIGFRFELLWPIWLLVRHLYESFRVHAFSSSLHYSAFSVFFVCVTATSDLVCYLFIPIQVLIFLASTYVWVQFVYQSTERGICFPSVFLWALFIVFEYSIRARFDAGSTWYLTRSSWITAGLFPSTADSLAVGPSVAANGPSTSAASSPRLELYRPFAAHCIGFPVVTFGFRVKSFFSKWRMRVRREEVRRQNEFFERLLADAVPTVSFDDRTMFISTSRSSQFLEQDAIDYELATYGSGSQGAGGTALEATTTNLLSSSNLSGGYYTGPLTYQNNSTSQQNPTTNLPQSYTAAAAAICAAASAGPPGSTSSSSLMQQQASYVSSSQNQQQNGSGSRKTVPSKMGGGYNKQQQNGGQQQLVQQHHRRNGHLGAAQTKGATVVTSGEDVFGVGGEQQRMLANEQQQKLAAGLGDTLLEKLWQLLCSIFCLLIYPLHAYVPLIPAAVGAWLQNGAVAGTRQRPMPATAYGNGSYQNNQDADGVSTSGDGSNLADELDDCSDRELDRFSELGGGGNSTGGGGLPMGGAPGVHHTPVGAKNTKKGRKGQQQQRFRTPVNSSTASSSTFVGGTVPLAVVNGGATTTALEQNGGEKDGGEEASRSTAATEHLIRERTNELKQLYKEKQTLEQSMEKLRTELKLVRHGETELRAQLALAQQQERLSRDQAKQTERDGKTKADQLEARCRQLGKQNDNLKTNIGGLEKRISELQMKKAELERELANERLSMAKQHSRDEVLTKLSSSQESNDQLKARLTAMDRELKALRRDVKVKDEKCVKMDDEVRQLHAAKQEEGKQMESLRQKNFDLEQTLSAENRLKQDLFWALNESKAQIASLNSRLHELEKKDESFGGGGFGGGFQQHSSSAQLFSAFAQPPQPKALTPPSSGSGGSSALTNIDQLLQATGAQNMSYSLSGPADPNSPPPATAHLGSSDIMMSCGGFGSDASDLLTIGSQRLNGSAFASLIQQNNTKKNI